MAMIKVCDYNCSCVSFLLELGLDVNAVNDEGNTPLILATICLAETAAECAEVLIHQR
jgi:ankyrin repeat protein